MAARKQSTYERLTSGRLNRKQRRELERKLAAEDPGPGFGTSIAQSLRGHSEFIRDQTRQQAGEKAAKLGVKLVFPIFLAFCRRCSR